MEKKLIFPTILLSSIVIKSLITPSISISIAIACLSALFGVIYYIETKKEKPVNDEIRDELKKHSELLTWTKGELDKVSSFMSATKLSTSFNRK